MSTRINYSKSLMPLVVPQDCSIFAEQSLFNVMKCLSALNSQSNCLVCLNDIQQALKFVMRILPREMSDFEMHKVNIFHYDDEEI